MVSKAISKMKSGKAAGPWGIVIEMIKAGGDGVTVYLTSLPNNIICIGRNYKGLKLQEHVMKILESLSITYSLVSRRGTTDAIFILRQLQEKYLQRRKTSTLHLST